MHRGVAAANSDVDPLEFAAYAAELEAAGWDGLFVYDHLHLDPAWGIELHDPWLLLAAAAMRTERIRLGTAVTPISRRRPWQLAAQVVTLDHLSRGRAVVGVGLGGFDEHEFHAFGDHASLAERAARTDEALPLFGAFLRGDAVDHDGRHYEVHAHLRTRPVQTPRPPIWIAATPPHGAGKERAAAHEGLLVNIRIGGDNAPLTPEQVAVYVGDDLLGREGFDVVTFRHPAHAPADYEAVGIAWLLELMPALGWLDQARAVLDTPV